jgi:hypothetical protein
VPRTVTIVPHTHWDREWYRSFERFRMRLVELLDDLLPRLDADPSFAHFMLDGQMAVVDDYLEIRPDGVEVLRRLAADGRLAVGPWYVLMDEFLVSGETIVRDLQLGLRRAAELGGAMPVGYLPDMFGHVAQMPQLLRQAGLDHAVVWRGVPAAVDRSGFWWRAPDGSTVRAEYLPEGYGNGASLPPDGAGLVESVDRFVASNAEMLLGPLLWMYGSDHLVPSPELGRVVAEANAVQDRYHFVVGGLADHLADAPNDGLATWQGELRSGARSNLLMGVASNRVDVKQAAARAERGLERLAEPLSALFLAPDAYPAAFLDRAWHQVVLDAAHDSSCACSADPVVEAVLGRYSDAAEIADGLLERAVAALSHRLAGPGPTVVNPAARRRTGLVELRLPGTDQVEGTQQLSSDDGLTVVSGITRAECVQLAQRALDEHPHMRSAEVTVDDDGLLRVRVEHDPADESARYAGPLKAEVAALAAERPDGPARMEVVAPPSQRAVGLATVPPLGWAPWGAGPLAVEAVSVSDRGDEGVVVDNGLVRVVVDPDDGTFSLEGEGRRAVGLGRLVDDGDAGDTYNWCPPTVGLVVDRPKWVEVAVLEEGPLRARVEVTRRYVWPVEVVGGARAGAVPTEVTTLIEVQAGSGLVRLTTELDNRSRDHRLRSWFPLPEPARSSTAECAFAVVERSTVAEGGPTEAPLPTYPSRRFVAAGGLVVVHEGLLEYELVDLDERPDPGTDGDVPSAGALALTLLRCTGMLSQGPMPVRPLPAGPELPTPAAQLPGRHLLRYGVALLAPGTEVGGTGHALADELSLPLIPLYAAGGGSLPAEGSGLEVSGAEVSAVRREDGELTVRIFNPTAVPTTARVAGRSGRRVDLRGDEVGPFPGELALGPWEIATLRLDET